jgi:hypothetical protein
VIASAVQDKTSTRFSRFWANNGETAMSVKNTAQNSRFMLAFHAELNALEDCKPETQSFKRLINGIIGNWESAEKPGFEKTTHLT